MLLPLLIPSHCLACHKELLPDPERPERFCSYPCMMFYYGPPGAAGPDPELALTSLDIYLLKVREKATRVGADLQASMAMRQLTNTPLSEEDLEGLRWLAKKNPVTQAIALGLPLPPGPWEL